MTLPDRLRIASQSIEAENDYCALRIDYEDKSFQFVVQLFLQAAERIEFLTQALEQAVAFAEIDCSPSDDAETLAVIFSGPFGHSPHLAAWLKEREGEK